MPIAKELIDPDADKILRRLRRNGHIAFLVGGCVRDLLLGRTPKDFDIATSATPNEIKDLFRNSRIIGRRFRLAHIFFGQKIIETSTFRSNPREGMALEEVEELLIRRDNVFGTAEEDARRRDFTINGLFYDIEAEEVTDYVGGLADLEARLVRTIGDPDIRFREDPVRILRAIKFAARLDFQMEPATYAALLAHRGEIPKCAPPRVLEEIYRLLRGGAARRSMELLLETGVGAPPAPELVWMFGAPADDAHGPPPPGLPTGEALAECRLRAWRMLDEIDVLVAPPRDVAPGDRRAPAPPTNALLLAALVAPFLVDGPAEGAGPAESGRRQPHAAGEGSREQISQVESVLMPLALRLRVSRRDAERARQILIAQRRLSPMRRRRARPMALVKRDYFGEALGLYEMLTAVRGGPTVEPTDQTARWRSLWRTAQTEPGVEGEGRAEAEGDAVEGAAGSSAPGKRRRRRRGGRRRRRAGAPTVASGAVLAVSGSGEAVPIPPHGERDAGE
jgi:poly(A) polymerase